MGHVRRRRWMGVVVMIIMAVIARDGSITVGPIEPEQYEQVRDTLMSMMRNIGSTVVETECISPHEAEEIVQQLAATLLRSEGSP